MNSIDVFNYGSNSAQTMSSRDIAELTKKEHKNVLRVIRELIEGYILAAQIEPLKFEYRGQWFDYYELNKRDSLVLVARLSPEFTAAVVDRWQELEGKVQAIDPLKVLSDPAAMRGLLLTYTEKVIELEHQVEELQPKAVALDTLANAHGSVTLDQAAKLLGVQPKKFLNPWLIDNDWCFRRSGDITPHQTKVDKKLLVAVFRTFQGNSGEQRTTVQTRVTSTGMAQLAIDLQKWRESHRKGDAA